MRSAVAVGAACAALGGCGGSDEVREALDPVAEAAQATQRAGGARISGSQEWRFGTERLRLTVDGEADFTERRARTVTDVAPEEPHDANQKAAIGLPHESIETADGSFQRGPGIDLPPGAAWGRVEDEELAERIGIDLSDVPGQADPLGWLELLQTSAGAEETGTEELDGRRTTRYRGTLDLRDFFESRADDPEDETTQRAIDRIVRAAGTERYPIEVWVDDDGLIRRERIAYTGERDGEPVRAVLTTSYTEFGDDHVVDLPSDDDVADVTDQAAEEFGG